MEHRLDFELKHLLGELSHAQVKVINAHYISDKNAVKSVTEVVNVIDFWHILGVVILQNT